MLCERCGEIAETFMTEGHGELCETCQKAVEAGQTPANSSPRKRLAEEP